jgi:hypothetical protein
MATGIDDLLLDEAQFDLLYEAPDEAVPRLLLLRAMLLKTAPPEEAQMV